MSVLRSELAGDSDMAELLRDYTARLPGCVAAIEQAMARGDADALQKMTHQLKGSGGGYGFPRITSQAQAALELMRQGAAVEQVRSSVEALVALLRSVDGYQRELESA